MFCRECGTENRNDRKFCSNCGAPLKDYTKPTENLIHPDEIKEKQVKVEKKNKVDNVLKVLSISFLIVAIVLSVISFAVNENFITPIIIIALICYAIALILYIIKTILLKRIENSINKEKK